jgi:hypothetical protein
MIQKGYLEFKAMPEISEAVDFVNTERDDFEIGHFLENGQILELISPQIQVLDTLQIVGLGFGNYQIKGQLLANVFVAHEFGSI